MHEARLCRVIRRKRSTKPHRGTHTTGKSVVGFANLLLHRRVFLESVLTTRPKNDRAIRLDQRKEGGGHGRPAREDEHPRAELS